LLNRIKAVEYNIKKNNENNERAITNTLTRTIARTRTIRIKITKNSNKNKNNNSNDISRTNVHKPQSVFVDSPRDLLNYVYS